MNNEMKRSEAKRSEVNGRLSSRLRYQSPVLWVARMKDLNEIWSSSDIWYKM